MPLDAAGRSRRCRSPPCVGLLVGALPGLPHPAAAAAAPRGVPQRGGPRGGAGAVADAPSSCRGVRDLPGLDRPVLRDVDLRIDEGELALVVGRTGSGKSTLLGAISGRVPHFTGGTLDRPRAAARPRHPRPPAPRPRRPRRRRRPGPARRVRHRHRRGGARLRHGAARPARRDDAQAGRGDPRPARHRRAARRGAARAVRRAAAAGRDRLGAHRPPPGHRARRADLGPRPDRRRGGARDDHPARARPRRHRRRRRAPDRAGAPLRRHRRARLAAGEVRSGLPADAHGRRRHRPSRRRARSLGRVVAAAAVGARRRAARPRGLRRSLTATLSRCRDRPRRRPIDGRTDRTSCSRRATSSCATPATCVAVAGVDLDLHAGEVTALMGRNGCGKSSLLWALQGSGRRCGRAPVARADATAVRSRIEPCTPRRGGEQRRSLVGLVPQSAADLLYLDTVGAECEQADRESGVPSRHLRAAARDGRTRHPATSGTRATCPRGSGSRSCSPSS